MARIKIDGLSNEIAKTLTEYTKEVEEGLEKAKKETAKEVVAHLKSASKPVKTGRYREGWASKKQGTAQVVHNKTDYQLTHLLEKGHAKRGGGRVAPIVHIKPAEDEAIKLYTKLVENVIKS